MRSLRPLVVALAGVATALACLVPPALDGKVCLGGGDGGSCAMGETCAVSAAGHGLGLGGEGVGLCSPLDAGCAGLTCPNDAGLYVCGGGACFAAGSAALGGLPCWSGLGRCRAEGLYLWELDGGVCLTDGTNLTPIPECRLDGGYVTRCACDGIDNDCDGAVNEVPSRPAFALVPEPLAGACTGADGGADLAPGDAGLHGGASAGLSGDCALFDLGASYAVANVTIEAASSTSACGVSAGSSVFVQLYGSPTEDGGFTLVGPLPGAAGSVEVGARMSRFAVCIPGDASHSALRVRAATITPAQECDTLPGGS